MYGLFVFLPLFLKQYDIAIYAVYLSYWVCIMQR